MWVFWILQLSLDIQHKKTYCTVWGYVLFLLPEWQMLWVTGFKIAHLPPCSWPFRGHTLSLEQVDSISVFHLQWVYACIATCRLNNMLTISVWYIKKLTELKFRLGTIIYKERIDEVQETYWQPNLYLELTYFYYIICCCTLQEALSQTETVLLYSRGR